MKKNKIIGLSVTALAFAAAAGVIGTRVAKEAIHAEGTKTVYCKMQYDWWKVNEQSKPAAIACHYWGGTNPTSWPGLRMSPVANDVDVWKIDVPTNSTGLMFVRVNAEGDTVSDWGAKTADLALPTDDKNLYTITSETAVWGDPGVTGAWSVYEEPAPAESSSADPFVDESKAGYYYLVGNGSFLNDTYRDHPWSYKAGVEMAKPAEGDDLGQLINQHLEKDDVFKLRVGQDSENTGWVGFSKVQDTSAKKYFDGDGHDNIEVQATGDYNIYINKDGLIYIFDATEPAEISGEIYFAPMAGGAPFANFYLYSWIGNGELESQKPLGDFPGTKLSEIEGVSGTNGLNFHGVYGALFKIPASALGGGEKFVLSTEGEVVKTNDFTYLDGSFYRVGYDAPEKGDKSLGAPAALAFDVDAAIKVAESVCNIETNKAKTLVQDYNKLDLDQKAVFEDSTFYTINSESEIPGEKIDVTGSAIINMINSHIVNGGEGSLYKTLGMNDSNRTLVITLAVIGAIAIASATFIVISKKRKAK